MPQTVRTFQLSEAQDHIIRSVEAKGFSAYIRRLITQDMEARGITWPQDNRSVGRQPKSEKETSS